MNKLKRVIWFLFALPLVFISCTDNGGGSGGSKLELKADKLTVATNETVTFTVKYNGNDVTADAKIKNEEEGTNLDGNTFKPSNPGDYKFIATYNDEKSAVVTVTVTGDFEMTLSVNTEVIYNDGKDNAVFVVKYGNQDVTADAVITNVTSDAAMDKGVATFASTTEGKYQFQAKYNNMTSNKVSVMVATAPENPLVIVASKPRIKADGSDNTTFKVMYMHTDVTASAKIKNLSTSSYLSENTFSYSGNLKKVEFQAEYDGKTSLPIVVGFGDFYKNVMLMRFTATWCGPCTTMGATLKNVEEQYPNRMVQVAVHSGNGDLLTSNQYSEVMSAFTHSGIPTLYFDFAKPGLTDGSASANTLISRIKESQSDGAKCGIAATSVISDNSAIVTVRATAAQAGTYYIGVMLVEDNITGYPQNGSDEGANYVHNNTFRSMATKVTGVKLGDMVENQELTKTFTFNLGVCNKDNTRIVIYINSDKYGATSTTNAISCPINGSVDYNFESAE